MVDQQSISHPSLYFSMSCAMKVVCHTYWIIGVTSKWLLDLKTLRCLRSHLVSILTCCCFKLSVAILVECSIVQINKLSSLLVTRYYICNVWSQKCYNAKWTSFFSEEWITLYWRCYNAQRVFPLIRGAFDWFPVESAAYIWHRNNKPNISR